MFEGKIIGAQNKHEKMLPLLSVPPIYYALYCAVRLSMILAHNNTTDWFFSNFIQLFYNERMIAGVNDHMIQFVSNKDFSHGVFLTETTLNESIIRIHPKDIISNIIKWIDEGYYIYLFVDVSKLPNTRHYHKNCFIHNVMIFGYDLLKKELKRIDFDINGNFRSINTKYDDFLNAFTSNGLGEYLHSRNLSNEYNIVLYRVSSKKIYPLNKIYILSQLKEYYNSSIPDIPISIFNPAFIKKYNMHFGMDTQRMLIEYLQKIGNEAIDIRAFRAVWEHKKVMCKRIDYFLKNNLLVDSELTNKFKKVEKKSNKVRMLSLKYNLTKDNEIINRMINLIEGIIKLETYAINRLMNELELTI